jgi:D-aminopeptidase
VSDRDHDPQLATPSGKPRARAIGIPLAGEPGPMNAITDVPGVEVGLATLVEGDDVRTGLTAIHPRGRSGPGDPCAAGFHSLNGNGEMTGVSWIEESGTMSGPIAITNTHAVGIAHGGIVRWTVNRHPALAEAWLLPVAAETWDGYLNDINGAHVTEETVVAALDAAAPGPVEEGSVGGGTGMCCYQFKGGTGTSSRRVAYGGDAYTVGVLVQANFGAREELAIAGVPLGEALADDNPMAAHFAAPAGAGSVIAIVATDAPLLPGQCKALARRVTLGLAPERPVRTSPVTSFSPSRQRTRERSVRGPRRSGATSPAATTRCGSSRGATWTRSTRPSSAPPRRRCSTRSSRTKRCAATADIESPRCLAGGSRTPCARRSRTGAASSTRDRWPGGGTDPMGSSPGALASAPAIDDAQLAGVPWPCWSPCRRRR